MKFTNPLHAFHWFVWIIIAKYPFGTNLVCLRIVNHEFME